MESFPKSHIFIVFSVDKRHFRKQKRVPDWVCENVKNPYGCNRDPAKAQSIIIHDELQVTKCILLIKNDGILYRVGKHEQLDKTECGTSKLPQIRSHADVKASGDAKTKYQQMYWVFSQALNDTFALIDKHNFKDSIASSLTQDIRKHSFICIEYMYMYTIVKFPFGKSLESLILLICEREGCIILFHWALQTFFWKY